jgi:hypothetical protein
LSAGYWWARYSPDVVDGVVSYLALDSGWAGQVRELREEVVDPCVVAESFTLGISVSAAEARAGSVLTLSRIRLFRQSTRRPKCDRKSTPMMGCMKSATTNRHVNLSLA